MKRQELEEELRRIKWDIIGLSELRHKGEEQLELRSSHLFYHRGSKNGRTGGMGFPIHKRLKNNIIELESISDRIASLNSCSLTSDCCEDLSSFLSRNQSLTELHLSDNKLYDSGVHQICSPNNDQIQKLSLNSCSFTSDCCRYLASFLSRNQSLTELDLSDNEIKDSGLSLICSAHNDQLQKLSLQGCGLTVGCCKDLISVLHTNQTLTELNLDRNNLQNSGVRQICDALKDPNCKLQTLRLHDCGLTDGCCEDLASVLHTTQTLTVLELGKNRLLDSGVREICAALKDPHSKLQKLNLYDCGLTDWCCEDLSTVLRRTPALTFLNLCENRLFDSGRKQIRDTLKYSNCKLQALILHDSGLTVGYCEDLASVLHTTQTLTVLYLGEKRLLDSRVRQICNALRDSSCKLQKLNLQYCGLTAGCCKDLASVLHTNQTLTELDLEGNKLGDSGLREICAALKDPNCELQTLK
nr:PREDICTED: ribonuclease inhibitor-like [Latimeria chalumnae]|eukprot:XP_014354026.1 PREDICTED: ribonuclease inhibitor-like [Latimeria chalumnae]